MPERPALDAVLFDAGGTLVRLDFEWMSECLAGLGIAVPVERLRRAEIEGRRRYDASRGRPPAAGEAPAPGDVARDAMAYFRGMLVAAGVPEARVPAVLERFEARHREGVGLWARPMEGARETLDRLGATDLRLAVVSNSDGRAEQHLVECGLVDGVEFTIDSHIVGVEKPDPAIFGLALDRLGVTAGRTLYIGDIRCVDQDGARAAGLHFVLIDPYGDYGDGAATIASIADLPDWLFDRFEIPGAGPGAGSGSSRKAESRGTPRS